MHSEKPTEFRILQALSLNTWKGGFELHKELTLGEHSAHEPLRQLEKQECVESRRTGKLPEDRNYTGRLEYKLTTIGLMRRRELERLNQA